MMELVYLTAMSKQQAPEIFITSYDLSKKDRSENISSQIRIVIV